MSRNVDEDLIEATIRRVAEARAARGETEIDEEPAAGETLDAPAAAKPASHPDLHLVTSDDDEAPDAPVSSIAPGESDDEDPIEATIRRVAEAKAARDRDEPPTATETASDEPAPHDDAPTAAATSDIDKIEETIRRVAAAKAEREQAPPETAAIYFARSADPDPAPPSWHEAARAPAVSHDEPRTPWTTPHPDDPVGWESAVAKLERELAETRRALLDLTARFDAALPLIEGSTSVPHPQHRVALDHPESDDDAFDDAPQISRMPFAAPPRPATYRDPSPRTATAEPLVAAPLEAVADVRSSSPSPAIEPRRGFDLLPRGYRVTVEDKRRDVDLVPLHRALLQMEGMKDMSLLSYSNGVAIISLEMTATLDPDALCATVARAMAREASVEVHNDATMVVKLSEE